MHISFLHLLKKYSDLLLISASGVTIAEFIKHINLGLQTLILLATLAGLLIRIFKKSKK